MNWFTKAFGWTVLAKGIWHGKKGRPMEEHFTEMDSVKADIENANDILTYLQNLKTKKTREPDGLVDDYGEIIPLVRTKLKQEGVSVDKLDQKTMIGIIRLLSTVVKEARNASESSDPKRWRLSFLEAEFIHIAEEKISRIHEKWSKKKNKLESLAKQIQHHFDDTLEEYLRYHKKHEEKEFRLPARMFNKLGYILFMGLIAIGEFFFNLQAFQILRVPQKEVFFIALAPSLAFPLLAHFTGTKLRQGFLPNEKRNRSILAVTISGTCILLGIIGVTMLRWDYIKYIMKTAMSVWQILAFFMINLLFLGGALIGAYLSHDPDRDLDTIYHHKQALRKRLNKLWKKWRKVASKFDSLRAEALDKIKQVRYSTLAMLDEYRHGVSLGNAEGKIPEFFHAPTSENLFVPRDLGHEIDLTPPPLEKILEIREAQLQENEDQIMNNIKKKVSSNIKEPTEVSK